MLLALYPTIAYIGPIRLYGLMIAAAVLSAYFLSLKLAPKFGITGKQIDEALLWLVIFGFLGARLYFAAFFWDYFKDYPQEILAVWRGGLSIYGGIIGGLAGLLIYAKKSGLNLFSLLDLTAIVLPLGQAIGRWGNFFNQEAFGQPTDLPWKMYVEPQFRPVEYLTFQYFHPAFLYESLWDLLVFFILWRIFRSKPQAGRLTASYLILYPLGRFFIESIRLDSVIISGIRVDQVTSLAMMVSGAVVLMLLRNEENY